MTDFLTFFVFLFLRPFQYQIDAKNTTIGHFLAISHFIASAIFSRELIFMSEICMLIEVSRDARKLSQIASHKPVRFIWRVNFE